MMKDCRPPSDLPPLVYVLATLIGMALATIL
jgi:hypothetical protein